MSAAISGVRFGGGAPALILAEVSRGAGSIEVVEERVRLAALAGADGIKVDADLMLIGRSDAIRRGARVAVESHTLFLARCRTHAALCSAIGAGADAIELGVAEWRDVRMLAAAADCDARVVLAAEGASPVELQRVRERLGARTVLTMLANGVSSLAAGRFPWGHAGDDLDPIRAAAAVVRGAAAIERPYAPNGFHDLVLRIRAEEATRLPISSPRPTAA